MNPYATGISDTDDTLAGSSALYFPGDGDRPSILAQYGLNIRECIVLSFISDQGPMDVRQLSRVANLEPDMLLDSVDRLADAGFIARRTDARHSVDSFVILTSRGQQIASSINEQL